MWSWLYLPAGFAGFSFGLALAITLLENSTVLGGIIQAVFYSSAAFVLSGGPDRADPVPSYVLAGTVAAVLLAATFSAYRGMNPPGSIPAPPDPPAKIRAAPAKKNKAQVWILGAIGVIFLYGGIAAYRKSEAARKRRAIAAPISSADTSAGSGSSPGEAGTLKVWVPAGVVGDAYWIYVNGKMVSSPPHGPADPIDRGVSFQSLNGRSGQANNGWELWSQGANLRMQHENYDRRLLATYISPGWNACEFARDRDSCDGQSASPNQPQDPLHLFEAYDLSVAPGLYTVEVAILTGASRPVGSFPFVITRKYAVRSVQAGWTSNLYVAVPDSWSAVPYVRAAAAHCGGGPEPPEVEQLQRGVSEYLDDPVVRALHGVDTVPLSRPNQQKLAGGVVVLHLPLAQGGSREFDGSQINHIAQAIVASTDFPNSDAVTRCRDKSPQFSRSYAEYAKILDFIFDDLNSFYQLAEDLGRYSGR